MGFSCGQLHPADTAVALPLAQSSVIDVRKKEIEYIKQWVEEVRTDRRVQVVHRGDIGGSSRFGLALSNLESTSNFLKYIGGWAGRRGGPALKRQVT
eukprot:354731-Chlamydomonas_euryale.AAC.12